MKNKMKAWRKNATAAKLDFLANGAHQKGMRYGRIVKAHSMGTSFKALPSVLFQSLLVRAGLAMVVA